MASLLVGWSSLVRAEAEGRHTERKINTWRSGDDVNAAFECSKNMSSTAVVIGFCFCCCAESLQQLDFFFVPFGPKGQKQKKKRKNRMATLTQRDIKTLMPSSKNIQKRVQCVKAFSRQQKRALGSAITESSWVGAGRKEKSTKSH